MRDELAPAISQLLDRAERQLERRDRRLETLKARAELQQGRLSMSTGGGDVTRKRATATAGKRKPAAARSPSRRTSTAARGALPHEGTPLDGEARLRAKAVRQRREALQYSVERMELEVLQKERELRKRLEKAAATAGAG